MKTESDITVGLMQLDENEIMDIDYDQINMKIALLRLSIPLTAN